MPSRDEIPNPKELEVLADMADLAFFQVDGNRDIVAVSPALERMTGFTVPASSKANTVSGLLMRGLQRIPEPGDVLEDQNFRFTVEDIKGRRVQSVRIDYLGEPESAEPEERAPEPAVGD